ncbi:MAG: tRNA pseudouridine(38-40) synthase TruA, partial [Methylococcales bacterium]|nr:tRNA pseudouridine(38-40) synthase TruA [Methylococcales bacterium]
NRQTTWYAPQLDAQKMHQAAQCLIGQHDFTSFRAQGCQSKSPFRTMYFIDVQRNDEKVIIELSANAFLHHMVRNIAGVLMAIGAEKQPVSWTQELLDVKCRKSGGVTAPSDGLHLAGVYYPEHYGIIKNPIFNKLPADARRFD